MGNSFPNTFYTLILFCLATIGYFVYKNNYNNNDNKFPDINSNVPPPPEIYKKKWKGILTVLYAVIVYAIFVLVNIVNSNLICNTPQYGSVLYSTTISCFVMFFCLIFLLNTFTSWLIPFSNTIGYGITSTVTNLPRFILLLNPLRKRENDKSRSDKFEPANAKDDEPYIVNDELKDEIKLVYGDPSLLINKFNVQNFDDLWDYYKENIFSTFKLNYLITKACKGIVINEDAVAAAETKEGLDKKVAEDINLSKLSEPEQLKLAIGAAVLQTEGDKRKTTKSGGGTPYTSPDPNVYTNPSQPTSSSASTSSPSSTGSSSTANDSIIETFRRNKTLNQFLDWYISLNKLEEVDINVTIKQLCQDSLKQNFENDTLASFVKYTFNSYVKFKTLISEFIWYFLTGYLTITTIFNYIVNKPCYTSPDDLKKAHQEHIAIEKEKEKQRQTVGKSNIVYKITE